MNGTVPESKSDQLFNANMHISMHLALALGTVIAFASGIANLFADMPMHAAINLTRGMIGLLFWIYAFIRKDYRFGYLSQVVIIWVGACILSIADGGIVSPNVLFLVIIGPFLYASGARNLGLTLSYATIAMTFVLWWTYKNGLYISADIGINRRFVLIILATIVFIVACRTYVKHINIVLDSIDAEHEIYRKASIQKSKFFIHINHELRNPLTAILSAVELLRKLESETSESQVAIKEKKERALKSLHSTCDHIISIVNDVLDFERLSTKNTIDINDYVDFDPRLAAFNTINILSAKAAEKQLNVICKADAGLPQNYKGPIGKVQQVLLNLISNALQHSGGDVTVFIRGSADQLEYRVSDVGNGISREEIEHLFVPFSAGLGYRGTSGLGLSICKTIVEDLLLGSIKVESEPGRGTTFIVKLPLKANSTEWVTLTAPTKVKFDDSFEALKGLRILFVEDDKINNEMTSLLLSECGLNVSSAFNSTEALELLRSSGPFDVAVIDNDLGAASKMNGIGLTVELLNNGLKNVIGFTGNYSESLAEKWKAVGVNKIILKPANTESILCAISAVIKQKQEA